MRSFQFIDLAQSPSDSDGQADFALSACFIWKLGQPDRELPGSQVIETCR